MTETSNIRNRLQTWRGFLASEQANLVWAIIFCLFLGTIFLTAKVRLHRNIYYLLVLLPFLIQVPRSFWAEICKSPVFIASLTFLGYLWVSLFWSSQSGLHVFYNEARTLVILLSFLAICAFYSLTTPGFVQILARILACMAGIAASISIYVFYSAKNISMMGGLESRVVDIGLAGHPIDSAGLYGFVAVFLIFALFVPARKTTVWTWLCALSLLAILAFVGLTQTRGAIIGILLVLVLGLLFQGGKRLWLALSALAAVILGVVLLSYHHPEGMIGFERRFGVRGEIWRLALERAWEHPWFGFGLNEHQRLFLASGEHHGVAHNMYLENLHFGGLVGSLLLLALAGLALRAAWLDYRRSGSFLLPALVLYPLIFGISAGYLTLSKISPMWVQFWLPIGLVIGAEIRQSRESLRPAPLAGPASFP